MPRIPLHCHFGLEAFDIPVDRGDGKRAPIAVETQKAGPARDVPLDRELVPFLGMADIVDLYVVMLTPEKRNVGKFLAVPEHIDGPGLPLPLATNPMFDANELAAVR